jgi:competence protein ComEC
LGLSHPFRFLLGSLGIWGYVLFIGLPDAACRAALILTLLALGRFLRRPVAPMGALASALLFFLVMDPGALLRPGFQLSFSGAFGLVAWGGTLARWLEKTAFLRRRRILASGLSAGVAATLATLPLVAWHFGRVSLVGIPVTLLAAPLVTVAIPGIFLSFLLSPFLPPAGAFLAQGVEVVLGLFAWLIQGAGSLSFASAWVSRPGVVAGTLGILLGLLWHRSRPGPPARSRGKGIRLAVGVLSGVMVWPLAERVVNRGILEVVMMDVGQGDALALRSPAGRWILVDAGPRTQSYDAGARRVVPYLRRRGVGEVALLVLTHPDMDHVGGARAVLEGISVERVLDPGRVVGTDVFLRALEGAEKESVPWFVARAGDSIHVDGVAFRVLWPPAEGGPSGSNESSVVLEVRFGQFSLLLTGDAPTEVEEAVLPHILSEEIQVLKVGHHGSSTSTSPELLERISPSVALISVGRRNRYGHPDGSVLGRLESLGARLFRTDEDGTVILRARRDGTFMVRRLTED